MTEPRDMKMPAILKVALLVALLMYAFAFYVAAFGATIAWQPNPPDEQVEYAVHWRDNQPGVQVGAAGVVTIATGTATSAWMPNPPPGVVRFAIVTATGSHGLHSLPSLEVCVPGAEFTVAAPQTARPLLSDDLQHWQSPVAWSEEVLNPLPSPSPAKRRFYLPVDRPRRFVVFR